MEVKYSYRLGRPDQGTGAGGAGRRGGTAVSGWIQSLGVQFSAWAAGPHGRAGPSKRSPGGFVVAAYSWRVGFVVAAYSWLAGRF